MRRTAFASAVLLLVVGLSPHAAATPADVAVSHAVLAHVELDATAVWCDNKGSTVEFSGTLVVGGLTVEISFKNNVKGTHELTTLGVASLEVTPANGTWTVPKQPVLGGVGGNPWISFQFVNGSTALSERILLGRCVQGVTLKHLSRDFLLPAAARALVQSLDCSNKGSKVSLSSSAARAGLGGTLYMDNNQWKVVHEASTQAKVAVKLWPAVTVPKQGSLGGPGGNPIITLRFLNDNGTIGVEFVLGRCVQLN